MDHSKAGSYRCGIMDNVCFHFPSLPDDYRCGKSLGPVEALQEHPQQSGKILIGYSRGLVVLWDLSIRHAEQLFLGKQVPVTVGAHCSCSQFSG